jgi:hypothetical protein
VDLDVTNSDVRNGDGLIALLEAFRATGGAATAEIVGRLLEEHQAGDAVSLAKLICTRQVFGFEWRASLWIPLFQFTVGKLSLKHSAQCVRAALPSLWSGWTLATWFTQPNARLNGRCAVDALDADPEAVIRAARSLDTVDEFAPQLVRRAHEAVAHV